MTIDWKGYLEKFRPEKGWRDAEGPEFILGKSTWFVADDGTNACVLIDEGYAELSLVYGSEDDEERSDLLLWSGDLDYAIEDPELGEFVAPPEAAPAAR